MEESIGLKRVKYNLTFIGKGGKAENRRAASLECVVICLKISSNISWRRAKRRQHWSFGDASIAFLGGMGSVSRVGPFNILFYSILSHNLGRSSGHHR